jgi:hypothetical protein
MTSYVPGGTEYSQKPVTLPEMKAHNRSRDPKGMKQKYHRTMMFGPVRYDDKKLMTKFKTIKTILMMEITTTLKNFEENNRDIEVMKNMLIISIMTMNKTIALKVTTMMMIMVKLGMLIVIMLIKIMIIKSEAYDPC